MELARLVTLGMILLLLGLCGLTNDAVPPSYEPPTSSPLTPSEPAPSPANDSVPPIITDPPLWRSITQSNVESVCLDQAKDYAESQGYSRSLVFECACNAQESLDEKQYACTISALDGSHDLSLDCVKSSERCQISSEAGTEILTFDEVQKLIQTS